MSALRIRSFNYTKLSRVIIRNTKYSTQQKKNNDKPIFNFKDPNADLLEWVTQSSSSPNAPLLPWYKIQLEFNEKLKTKQYYKLFLYLEKLLKSDTVSKNTLKLAIEHPGMNEMINHLVYPFMKDKFINFGKRLVELGYFPINWKLAIITLRYFILVRDEDAIWKLFELSRVQINLNKFEINEEFYNFLLGHYCHEPNEKYFQLIEFLKHHKIQSKWYYKSIWQFYSRVHDLRDFNFADLEVSINQNDIKESLKDTISYFDQNSKNPDTIPDGSMIVYITQALLRFDMSESAAPIIEKCLDLPESIQIPILSLLQKSSKLEKSEGFYELLTASRVTEQQKLAVLKPILNHIYTTDPGVDIPYYDFIDYLHEKEYSYPIYCILTKLFIKTNKSKEFHLFSKILRKNHKLDQNQLMTTIKGYDHFKKYNQVEIYFKLLKKSLGDSPVPNNIALIYMNSLMRTFNLDSLIEYYQTEYLQYYSQDLRSTQIVGLTCMRLGDLNRLDSLLIDPLFKQTSPSLTLLTPLLHYRFYLCIKNQLLKDSIESLERMFNLKIMPNFKSIQLIKIYLMPLKIFNIKLAEWDKSFGSHLVFRGFKNSLK